MSRPSHSNSSQNIKATTKIEVSRDFKGAWVPRSIYLHPELNALEKFLWSEIWYLDNPDNEHGGCFADEQHLREFTGVSRPQLYKMLANLKRLGLIEDGGTNGRVKIRHAIEPKDVRTERRHQRSQKRDLSGLKNETDTLYRTSTSSKEEEDNNIESAVSKQQSASLPIPPPVEKTFTSSLIQKDPAYKGKGIVKMFQYQWDQLVGEYSEEQVIRVATDYSEKLAMGLLKAAEKKNPHGIIARWLRNNKNNPKTFSSKKNDKPDWLRPEMCEGQVFECEDLVK